MRNVVAMETRRMKAALSLLCLLSALLAGCATAPHAGEALHTATVDLDRYMGRWYVIASLPPRAERGHVGSFVEYSRRSDGRINALSYFRDTTFIPDLQSQAGTATVAVDRGNALWTIDAGWSSQDTAILYVDDDYRYAVVGRPGRDAAWILCREIYVDDDNYEQLLGVLAANGYDRSRVLKIPQRPEYLGLPGYQ